MTLSNREKYLVTAVWLVGILLVWSGMSYILKHVIQDTLASTKLPYPHVVFGTFLANWQSLLEAGALTFSRAVLGFLIGTTIGVVLAVIISLSKTLERMTFPYLIASQMIPILGLAPIIFNIVRDMDLSRIIIAAYITFFPICVNMISGLKSVDQEKKELLYSIASSKFAIYKKLMFPFAMPYLFNGLKIAAPLAVTASVLVDMLGSRGGIGVKILYSLYSSNSDIFWASVLTSAFMGIISFYIVVFAENILLPWKKHIAKKDGA